MDRNRRVIWNGAIVINGDRIEAIEDVVPHTDDSITALDARGMIVMPGLIDAHVHLTECLMRNVGPDLPLAQWVTGYLRPIERALTPEHILPAIKLSLLEHLRSGTTTIAESLLPIQSADMAAEAVLNSGLRCALSLAVNEIADFRTVEAAHAKWNGSQDRLQIWIGLRQISLINEAVWRDAAAFAGSLDTRLSWHMSSAIHNGARVAALADEQGLLSDRMVAGHCVDLDTEDIARLADSGTHVVHLPVTNARFGMGQCPVPELRDANVSVAIGSDGDNSHDLFRVMMLAGLVNKARLRDARAFPAESLIEMATIGGARALGIADQVGSLEPGKKADIIMVRTDMPWNQPLLNPVATIVYGASGKDVDTVMVDGKILMSQGQAVGVDEHSVLIGAAAAAADLMSRSGLAVLPRQSLA